MQDKLFEEIDGEWMGYHRAGQIVRALSNAKFTESAVIDAARNEPGFDVWCKPDGRGWNVLFGVFRRKVAQYCANRDEQKRLRKAKPSGDVSPYVFLTVKAAKLQVCLEELTKRVDKLEGGAG
jgi:hypothetical protein